MYLNTLIKRIENTKLIIDDVEVTYRWANLWRGDRGLILELYVTGTPEIYQIATYDSRNNQIRIKTYI
jgi:hypothetical protein